MNANRVKGQRENHLPSSQKKKWLLGAACGLLLAGAGVVTPLTADAQAPRVSSVGQQNQDYHVVRSGDTIWDLSGFYFGDSFQWPRMWSYNPHITNPHWVYPGDIIYLRQVERAQAGAAGPGQSDRSQTAVGAVSRDNREQPLGLYLPLGGVITAEEMESVGRIIGSPKSARMLAEYDTVWLGFGENAYREDERDSMGEEDMKAMGETSVEPGDRFAIVRLMDTLKNEEGDTLGNKYIILGSLTIEEVPEQEGIAVTAMIDQSWEEIHRGDLIVPFERQLKLVQPRQAEQDLVAHIVDTLKPGFAFGPQQYVFIDRGAEDGVRVGNRFFIFQRFEGLDRPGQAAPPEIPWQRIGQVLVLDVRENYSTAVITRSSREVLLGDRLEMYSGH